MKWFISLKLCRITSCLPQIVWSGNKIRPPFPEKNLITLYDLEVSFTIAGEHLI